MPIEIDLSDTDNEDWLRKIRKKLEDEPDMKEPEKKPPEDE